MADNSRKTPLASTLPAFARKTFDTQFELSGYSLPGYIRSVTQPFVTVSFDVQTADPLPQVTIPVSMSRYVRLPLREDDPGMVISADAYLGPITGQGGSVATLVQPGNLGALAFIPLVNKDWPQVDPDAVVISAPNGAVIQDDDASASIVVTPGHIAMTADTQITLTVGGHSIVITTSGISIDGKDFLTHAHSGVQSGGSNTGPVT